ncbi:MAG: hypothetical protein ABIA21_04245 [Candidatus Aenigmatarchaeota archaeon]
MNIRDFLIGLLAPKYSHDSPLGDALPGEDYYGGAIGSPTTSEKPKDRLEKEVKEWLGRFPAYTGSPMSRGRDFTGLSDNNGYRSFKLKFGSCWDIVYGEGGIDTAYVSTFYGTVAAERGEKDYEDEIGSSTVLSGTWEDKDAMRYHELARHKIVDALVKPPSWLPDNNMGDFFDKIHSIHSDRFTGDVPPEIYKNVLRRGVDRVVDTFDVSSIGDAMIERVPDIYRRFFMAAIRSYVDGNRGGIDSHLFCDLIHYHVAKKTKDYVKSISDRSIKGRLKHLFDLDDGLPDLDFSDGNGNGRRYAGGNGGNGHVRKIVEQPAEIPVERATKYTGDNGGRSVVLPVIEPRRQEVSVGVVEKTEAGSGVSSIVDPVVAFRATMRKMREDEGVK